MALLKKGKSRPWEAIKVLLVGVFAAAVLWLASPTVATVCYGLPLVLAGALVRAWAAGHLRRNKELATSGPYAYLRDPLYLGRLFLLCGFAIMANNAWTWGLSALGLAVFFLNYMPRKLRKETTRLEGHFGDVYVRYRKQVRSLIPRLTRYPDSGNESWQWAVYWGENHEQWLSVTILAAIGVMLFKALQG